MSAQKKILNMAILTSLVLMGCSKDEDPIPVEEPTPVQEEVLSDAKQITRFVFLAAGNNALEEDVQANLNEADKLITATVPYMTDITALLPTIEVSAGASISTSAAQDFSDPVNYEVTAEDGSKVSYNVVVSITPNNEGVILSFAFLADVNNISDDVFGIIDEENNTISLEVPIDADLSETTPTIEISPDASISPQGEQDFTQPVTYTVTAQDGTETEYLVIADYSEYEILAAIFNANPNNTLDWNLADRDVSNWTGVSTSVEGYVTGLTIDNSNLERIPPAIGKLNRLTRLNCGNNNLIELPSELWQLTQLEFLYLYSNEISQISPQINNLDNLKVLWLFSNNISSFPEQTLGSRLSNLESLLIGQNNLQQFPRLNNPELIILSMHNNNIPSIGTIAFVEKLQVLNLSGNRINRLDQSIATLTELRVLELNGNDISELPLEIGQLSLLIELDLGGNQIDRIPETLKDLEQLEILTLRKNELRLLGNIAPIAFLENLERLDLRENPLTQVQQKICDMQNNGTELLLDEGVTCFGG